MTARQAKTLATLLIGVLWALAAYVSGPQGSPAAGTVATSSEAATSTLYPVVHVVDGDTIDVLKDGARVRVRLIGIDTPETVDPRRPLQCFGVEASNEMKRIASSVSVALKTDPTQDLHDKYGRLLAYVFLKDGTNVNLHMITAGYAYEYTYDRPYEYQAQFKAAQADAQGAGRGLWAAGVCGH